MLFEWTVQDHAFMDHLMWAEAGEQCSHSEKRPAHDTLHANCEAGTLDWNLLRVVALRIPLPSFLDALLQARLWMKSQSFLRVLLIGAGDHHIPGLHGKLVDDRLLPHATLDHLDELVQRVGRTSAQVHDAKTIWRLHRAHHPFDDIVDVRELTDRAPIAILVNGVATVDLLDELERRHVWPSTWSEDSEETEHRDGRLVEVPMCEGKELVRTLRGCIWRYRPVACLVLAEGGDRGRAIDRRGARTHEIRDLVLVAHLEDDVRAVHIGHAYVGRVLDRIANTCLCSEVHDAIERTIGALRVPDEPNLPLVPDVALVEPEIGVPLEDGERLLLEPGVVVIVDEVDANNIDALLQETLTQVAADETCSTSDTDARHASSSHAVRSKISEPWTA